MLVEFNTGAKYEYSEVPHQLYTQFRLSESQGKFFNSKISKTLKKAKSPQNEVSKPDKNAQTNKKKQKIIP